jgi:2-methylisocitrate lyase-like PEP mutase family enzyme
MSSKPFRPAAAILREQLQTNKIVVCPGVYDGFTARLALAAGHKTLYMTGAGTSLSKLGQPDLALITLPEMLGNAAMIAGLDPSVPLIADADVGFGGPLSVRRTVKAYIDANIAGLHIEDQVCL